LSGSLIFLIHPGAGSGRNRSRLARLLAGDPALRERAVVCLATSPDDARAHLQRLAGPAVAVGGDGTANMVATALDLEGAGRPLGVLPFGTGNAFAHSLGVGTVAPAVRALRTGAVRTIDVLRTDHHAAPLALVSISCGFEARHILRYAELRRWTRPFAMALAVLDAVPQLTRGVRFTADSRELSTPDTPIFNAGVYNHPRYLGGWMVWKDADAGDGAAEAVVCRSAGAYARTLWNGLRTAVPSSPGGNPAWARCSRAVLEGTAGFQVDGETVAGTRMQIEVGRGALQVLVPPDGVR
jgi:diacylglycerol kinase (ATP)